MATTITQPEQSPELKRVMGPGLLLLFIVGDILGAGVYAVTGTMAGYVGGILWLPFLLAFVVATMTAFSKLIGQLCDRIDAKQVSISQAPTSSPSPA